MPILEKIMLFVEPLGLALLMVYAYSFFSRSARSERTVNIVMGGIFGICAIAAMSTPIEIADGVIVDMRNLFVGLAAAYFGLIGGAIALLAAGVTRVMIGGDGMYLGLLALMIAAGMGLIWARWIRIRIKNDMMAYVALGLAISAHLVAGLFLPASVRDVFFDAVAPTLFIADVLGAFLLSTLIGRERAFITERDTLRSAASTDSLTGLMNRDAAVSNYGKVRRVKDPSQGAAMLCIDVDHFKTINDTHGHLRGDKVLVEISARMSACLRPDDIFARMSGDEFVIVLNHLSAEQAHAVASRCQESVAAEPVMADGVDIDVSVSVGCTWVPGKPGFNELRFSADEALYRAKEHGRNCLAFEKKQGPLSKPRIRTQVAA